MIGELTDILLDVGQLTAHPRYVDQAVRELWAGVPEFREIQIEIEKRVLEMAKRSGAERSSALLYLIRRRER